MGANVIVTEIDAVKALEAAMDGFRVMPMHEAAPIGDLFCTVTGNIDVVTPEHFKKMKDGTIVCNSGHFDGEVDVAGLKKRAKSARQDVRPFVDEYIVRGPTSGRGGRTSAKRIYLLADGRLVNLAAAEGHPASVMDMSFSTQALACEWMATQKKPLAAAVYDVPHEIEEMVAKTKLYAMGIGIEKLTPAQKKYLSSWQEGT
jgi:adenosylhomocysteinase